MKRRQFLQNSMLTAGGSLLLGSTSLFANNTKLQAKTGLYELFSKPDAKYHPFVRWWWNGNKVEEQELIRELHLLKEAGIGGVEINPIKFPSGKGAEDNGTPSLQWLSDEWIKMLQVVFAEAKKLGMICDLIVGSGWPFGAESLERHERAKTVVVSAFEIEGPTTYEVSRYTILKEADPKSSIPCPGRTMKLISLKLVPDPVSSLDDAIDLNDKCNQELITFEVPKGKHVLTAIIQVDSFTNVINGAPGAAGPILDHLNKTAVEKYLNKMSDGIQAKTGPLSNHIRALFSDSMELEGTNWCDDMADEFKKRNGYDVMPYLPYIFFKLGRLGVVEDWEYGAEKTPEFKAEINRVRFDFEYTKAQLLYERFTLTYLEWCKKLGVKSRAQSYGLGFFPLKTGLGYDIPEGESWTTNWLHHRVGEEMPDDDYRRGRGYTMINKYVSSAAHLTGKRLVSCEEMTNTYKVFNTSLELLKVGSDQSIMSGITHSIWHGFNYSPPEAPFPGWVQYGSYYNENNNWWPYFKYLNEYKARVSALLQNSDMYSDIAILPANKDLWAEKGTQVDPFPLELNVPYTSILWESINKNGGAADYTVEYIIENSEVRDGKLCYGPKAYGTLIIAEVTSMEVATLKKIHEFVEDGGRVFCIEKFPEKSPGLSNYSDRDKQTQIWVGKLKKFSDRFIRVKKPADNRFLEWYKEIMYEYKIPHYLDIEKPNRFVMQNRYQADDGSEILFFANAHLHDGHSTKVTFSKAITKNNYAWIYNVDSGERYRLPLDKGSFQLTLGPAESKIIVFDKQQGDNSWNPVLETGQNLQKINGAWDIEFNHRDDISIDPVKMYVLEDLKNIKKYAYFCGTVIYKKEILLYSDIPDVINLGVIHGVSELFINGESCGVKWYGNRIHSVKGLLKEGKNQLEVRVVTLMGNYMKTLTDNKTAQLWTNRKGREQAQASMGMVGPVSLYTNPE